MSDAQNAVVLAGEDLASSPDQTPTKRTIIIDMDPALIALMTYCPSTWQGDVGMQNWAVAVFNAGVASVPPPPPPPPPPAMERPRRKSEPAQS